MIIILIIRIIFLKLTKEENIFLDSQKNLANINDYPIRKISGIIKGYNRIKLSLDKMVNSIKNIDRIELFNKSISYIIFKIFRYMRKLIRGKIILLI